MKGILIDVFKKEIREVEVDSKNVLRSWYNLIHCSMVETAHYFNGHDSIMVDEEGIYSATSDSMFFSVRGGHQPFIGNGLVVGVNSKGETVDVKMSVDEVRLKVKFHTINEVM